MNLLGKFRTKKRLFQDECRYIGRRIAYRNLALWVARKFATYRAAIIYRVNFNKIANPTTLKPNLKFGMEPISAIQAEILDAADIYVSADHSDEKVFVARSDSEIAFIARVTRGCFVVPRRHVVEIPGNAVYISCCYTVPAFRGKGLYGIGIHQIAELNADTADHAFLYVEFENEASIRAVLKMGFLPVARSSLFCCGPLKSQRFAEFSSLGSGLTVRETAKSRPSPSGEPVSPKS